MARISGIAVRDFVVRPPFGDNVGNTHPLDTSERPAQLFTSRLVVITTRAGVTRMEILLSAIKIEFDVDEAQGP
jgi:hypothetical protein